MKIAVLFLLCFVSATWQQHVYQSYPARYPFYSVFEQSFQNYRPILPGSDSAGLQVYSGNIYADHQQQEQEIAQRNLVRPPKNNHQNLMRANSEPRFFGISNYLGSVITNPMNLFSTVTSYKTVTSVITAGTMFNCFTSTVFIANPPPCRRKRGMISAILIGKRDDAYPTTSSFNSDGNAAATTSVSEELSKEGQNIDATHLVKSSLNEERVHVREYFPKQTSVDRYIRQNRNFAISVTITSTVTSYSVYYSTSSRIFSDNFAGAISQLGCVPPGMNVC